MRKPELTIIPYNDKSNPIYIIEATKIAKLD
jgi:hypothetical protein